MKKLLRIILILLLVVCIFDPADKMFGLKVPLFIFAWLLFIFNIITNNQRVHVSLNLILYLMLFLLIPLISITYYFFISNGYVNYDGYRCFKSYLFITITLIFYISEIDLIKPMVVIMSVLSILTIMILIISYLNVNLSMNLYENVGHRYGIWSMGSKDFGRFILPDSPQVFFHTAPLLVFAIAYFTMKVFYSTGATKILYGLLSAINIFAMFLGATKSNIVFSIMTPIFVALWYAKSRKYVLYAVAILVFILCIDNLEVLKNSVFNPNELSNLYKISFLKDYLSLFADVRVLLFGQGLGSFFKSTMRGFVSLTELTYFEFIRKFGLILSLILFALIFYPLSKLRFKKFHNLHYVFIAYLCYLMMSFSNPLLMSSSGMLLLSLVLHKTFSTPSSSGVGEGVFVHKNGRYRNVAFHLT